MYWLREVEDAFQPTRPLRGATKEYVVVNPPFEGFQPTRPLRGATEMIRITNGRITLISTHAPLAGRDGLTLVLI